MLLTRILLLALSLFFLSGCAATRQISQDMQNLAEETRPDDIFRMIKPADGPIYSDYGVRRRSVNKKPRFHAGIDIAAKRGSDVLAAASGTVMFSGRKGGYGNTVKIDHGNERYTLYAHMDKVFVSKGQTLTQGERIGLVGRTGRTTGPHLHFELHVNGQHINPIPEEGWMDPALNIAAASAEASAPSPDAAASDETAAAKANSGELSADPVPKPMNPIFAFFRKKTRSSGDSGRKTDEAPKEPSS